MLLLSSWLVNGRWEHLETALRDNQIKIHPIEPCFSETQTVSFHPLDRVSYLSCSTEAVSVEIRHKFETENGIRAIRVTCLDPADYLHEE